MRDSFRKNTFVAGLLAGLVLFGAMYALLYFVVIPLFKEQHWMTRVQVPMMISIIPNLLCIRLLFVNWKMEKAGRGLLFITFILMVAIFLFFKQ